MIWSGVFAPLSVILSDIDPKLHIEKTVLCTKMAIILSNTLGLSNVRDAFISLLSKGMQFVGHNELKLKNVLCIKALIDVAMEKQSDLGSGWKFIFECMSKLENLFNIKSGHSDKEIFGVSLKEEAMDNKIYELLSSRIDPAYIDMVFLKSVNIDDDKIEEFIFNLCQAAHSEIEHREDPRIFCLQKIVDVADINLSRPRTIWSRMWKHISLVLIKVSNNTNKQMIIYAIDSLKQLTTKLLTVFL